ncbi:MAG: ubiquitin-like protein Pup [Candidatus Tectomicrobia bacterium]|nr:ubiquitin-like protein Pup [Candidatus Tectomicrobia bacterium]
MITRRVHPSEHPWAGIPGCAEGGQQQARRTSETQTEDRAADAANLSEQGEKLQDDMDALIDEIDEVLEENAEEFVKNYVQRGGE